MTDPRPVKDRDYRVGPHCDALLKIGAIVRVSVRRIKIAMASACPAAQDWGRAAIRLALAALARASPA